MQGKKKLMVLGVHLNSEAYPNTRFRLQGLMQSSMLEVSEINCPVSSGNLNKSRRYFGKIWMLARGIFAHFMVITRYLFTKKTESVYVPYPAVFVLFLLSWLPRQFRPGHIFTDAFISLYDTIVNDRGLLSPKSLAARSLYRVEKRAYSISTKIVVDTRQNVHYLMTLFQLDPGKVIAIPLATDESHFLPKPYVGEETGSCRILFVGTLIPLHGIETILEAARILAARRDIVFMIVGDGQEAAKIEQWKSRHDIPLHWLRQWQTSSQLSREIEKADVCLGIFGAGNKTQRVCPFKIYAYAAVGRPIVTGNTDWARSVLAPAGERYFDTVPVADPLALANKISQLADDVNARNLLAANSRKFYEENLSNKLANEQLVRCILSS